MNQFDQLAAPGYPVFLGSEQEQPKPEDARFHIIPAPYEESVSYGGGTAKGPAAILAASWQLETWDGKSTPAQQGIYTHAPVDMGGTPEEVIERISQLTQEIVKAGKMPVMLGGEHTVTYGVIKGLLEAGVEDFGVVQIDAHADLRDAYEDNPYSHASVMKRIVDEDVPLFQLGVRAMCQEEIKSRKVHGVRHLDAEVLVPKNVQTFELPDEFPEKVYFTLDIDGMDPSIFPSTGTPVPGGLGWYQTLALFESVRKQRQIIGFDIVEFAPIEGFHAYEFSAALLAYKMMGIIERPPV
ncbi:MAG: agmatinase [Gammaproteobacteria bacterium]|uniref:agmatinase n=1 Tax=Pseudomaricurvus alcaniphilus TaxID=1166482 RepID=UPI0014095984|nr:agmatinase [Pseudomaricurvus alcaniphilus]MBR9909768.1 agmatinase [Gammaproteobacteria bacterium]NHN38487.1 agmatinase [Pseudomaricurvus alcaniphilus]